MSQTEGATFRAGRGFQGKADSARGRLAVPSRLMTHRAAIAFALSTLVSLAACGGHQEEAPPPAAPPPAQPVAYDWTGHWEGAADLTTAIEDAPEEMDIVAVLTDDSARCGTIEYGSIGCSGEWTCTGGGDGQSMIIQENIRFGAERCPPGARVELRRTGDPNVLEFHYSSPAITAHGQINRRQLQ